MTRKDELVRAWLVKAKNDLETARLLIQQERRLLDVAVFHCQQAGEKSVKAVLTARDIVFPKTHSIEELVDLCTLSDPPFASFRTQAKELTPLAHRFRYPADTVEPTPAEAAYVLQAAERLYYFCAERIRS